MTDVHNQVTSNVTKSNCGWTDGQRAITKSFFLTNAKEIITFYEFSHCLLLCFSAYCCCLNTRQQSQVSAEMMENIMQQSYIPVIKFIHIHN